MGSDEKEVLQKSNRYLRLKNVHGKSVCVVREVYRREVVPCQSQLCLSGCPNIAGTVKILKIGIPKIITIIVLKTEQFGFLVQKSVGGIANSVDPDQTALSGAV